MGKAEAGSVKQISNQMKQKGLTRLRWYCQTCQKACRDANAFKQHTLSESHVRNMTIVGEDGGKKLIADNSAQFQRDFLSLLKTSHGEKQVVLNHFYNEYIADRHHMHQNATKWTSLTDFAKHLGREGICRVEETEKGLQIAWIDDSPEALKRQDALRRKEAQDRGDEEWEARMLKAQIERAKRDAQQRGIGGTQNEEDAPEDRGFQLQEGQKITLSFGAKPAAKANSSTATPAGSGGESEAAQAEGDATDKEKPGAMKPVSLKFAAKPQAKNVFAQAKKNAPKKLIEQPKKMSEAERIMREEMSKKRAREESGSAGFNNKKPRF